ncbi:hypothetical protein NE237_010107 [Protea cynaroides]|uniref:FAD/NAD(P)-binding domain-containing protein n=1 Tax=Protea cynaroides TaxID=273540 RepID=A0A9Q0KYN8_9MAGN|nr:hypothetical protein NE237_010107 [Protea cynaroides]
MISLYRPEQADQVFCISEKGRHLVTTSDGVSNKYCDEDADIAKYALSLSLWSTRRVGLCFSVCGVAPLLLSYLWLQLLRLSFVLVTVVHRGFRGSSFGTVEMAVHPPILPLHLIRLVVRPIDYVSLSISATLLQNTTMASEEPIIGKKRIVIVGGGVAGSFLAKTVQLDADVTLIDPKEYFEIPWANLRSIVEPSFAKRSLIRHTDYFKDGRVITSHASNITETGVLTTDGHLVPYDYLVIATGHANSAPKARTEKLQHYEAEHQKIKSADSILIIGGGPTGVELAGEIAVDFPEKRVTLVHRGSRLLEFVGTKASTKALDWLTAKKVEVILGQSVNLNSVSDENGIYRTSGGENIEADCHFVCAGQQIGSAWLKETILKDMLDMHGRLMVDENLRVKGWNNIFAIGDITDIQEIKQGYIATKHASVTARNLKLLMNEGKESKLEKYKTGLSGALVSLGRKEGLLELPFMTIIGCIPGYIKSGDMFVGKTRKEMGLESFPVENDESSGN